MIKKKNNKESNNENMHADSRIDTFSFSKCHKRNDYSLFLQIFEEKKCKQRQRRKYSKGYEGILY